MLQKLTDTSPSSSFNIRLAAGLMRLMFIVLSSTRTPSEICLNTLTSCSCSDRSLRPCEYIMKKKKVIMIRTKKKVGIKRFQSVSIFPNMTRIEKTIMRVVRIVNNPFFTINPAIPSDLRNDDIVASPFILSSAIA